MTNQHELSGLLLETWGKLSPKALIGLRGFLGLWLVDLILRQEGIFRGRLGIQNETSVLFRH